MGAKQIFIAHDIVWEALEQWFDSKGMDLLKFPQALQEDEDAPLYYYHVR